MLERKSINNYLNNTSKINLASVLKLVDEGANKWEIEFIKLSLLILKDIGNLTYSKLANNKSLNIKAFSIDNILKLYISKYVAEDVKAINETTKESLKVKIEEGIAKGYSIAQITKSINELYLKDFSKNRAETIAITETVSASNFASLQGAIQAEEKHKLTVYKTWLSAGDNRVRPSHRDADGQSVRVNEKFEVGGNMCDMPGDPNLPPDERIRCRCVPVYDVL